MGRGSLAPRLSSWRAPPDSASKLDSVLYAVTVETHLGALRGRDCPGLRVFRASRLGWGHWPPETAGDEGTCASVRTATWLGGQAWASGSLPPPAREASGKWLVPACPQGSNHGSHGGATPSRDPGPWLPRPHVPSLVETVLKDRWL